MEHLTQQEAIKRLCQLAEDVAESMGYQHPCDCFCGLIKVKGTGYENDGVVISFIEAAVQEKIDRKESV